MTLMTNPGPNRRSGPNIPPILPSRSQAIDALRAAEADQAGLVLLTGEPGVGKTWLWRRLDEGHVGAAERLAIDVSPGVLPNAFLRGLAGLFGWSNLAPTADPAERIAEALGEAAEEGRRHALVVDEVQNASDDVLEVLRLLGNRLGRPDGFASILLVGQTPLVRRLRGRSLQALNSRITRRLHLGPIGAEEAGQLLRSLADRPEWSDEAVAECHRWSRGNPTLLQRIAPGFLPAERPTTERALPVAAARTTAPVESVPLLKPNPPLIMDEEMVEVGWDPRHDVESRPESTPDVIPQAATIDEVAVDDPFAALQAWEEWTRNRERVGYDGDPAHAGGPDSGSMRVWSEDRQPHAPFGDLFALTTPSAGEPEA